MKRTRGLVLAAIVAATTFAGGCLVTGRHGHIAWVVPPLVAAAVVASNPGHVWVEGHWDWVGDQWIWSDGYWMAERPGFVWEQGLWLHVGGRYEYRPGLWRPAPRVQVRDHRH